MHAQTSKNAFRISSSRAMIFEHAHEFADACGRCHAQLQHAQQQYLHQHPLQRTSKLYGRARVQGLASQIF